MVILYSLRCIVLFLAAVIVGIQPGPIFLAVFSQWDQIFKDPMATAAVESFQADHQRHTELVYEQFRSFFSRPESAPLLHATLRSSR